MSVFMTERRPQRVVDTLARALVAWFDRHQRALPWREDAPRDPYRVWVSEVMLQQTRVDTVLRYYAPFLERFPTVRALANADEESLMKAWEGLGYYRRARHLHKGARAVVSEHGGELPRAYDALRALPGFGPYTAGAVASLAFGEAVPAVDGNVLRVAARLTAMAHDVATPAARREVETWVRKHQPPERAGAFNEALMELGATVCTPSSPRCGACPVRDACEAHRLGRMDDFPVKAPKAKARRVRVALALARRGDAMLLEKRDAGLLAGTWGLPWVEVPDGADARTLLAQHVATLVGAPVEVEPAPARRGRHVFTHRRWEMEAYEVRTQGAGGAWRAPREVALGTAHRRLLDL